MSGQERSIRELLRVCTTDAVTPVDLTAIDPRSTPGLPPRRVTGDHVKSWARAEVREIGAELGRHQEMLFASAKVDAGYSGRVLLVLQAMDCGGKDGTIRRVAGAMNPLGLHIRSFGPPTEEERSHHFLWRIRHALPVPGQVGIFNRSHYEDVLVVRVHDLVPRSTWMRRYAAINRFEARLVDDDVRVVKVFLHISKEEQRQRLLARLDNQAKHWKFNPNDVDERAFWADYQEAYGAALERCNSDAAPWYRVPADRKWYRDWAIASLLAEQLEDMKLAWPKADFDVEEQRARLLADS